MTDSQTKSSAERLSEQTGLTERILSDSGEPERQTEPPRRVTLRSRFEPAWLHTITSKYALVLVWAAMALGYLILMPTRFGSWGAFSSIFGSQQVLVFLAMSAMITLVVGEFDLSIASVMGIAATLVPVLAGVHGWNIWLACLVAIGVCLLAGAVNAFFVVVMDVSSFVVTLGTGTLLIGLAQMVSGSNIVSVNSPAAEQARDARGARHARLVLLRHPAGRRHRLRPRLDAPRAQHDLRRRQPGGRPPRRHPRPAHPGRRLPGRRRCSPAWPDVIIVATVGGFDSSTSATYLLPALAAVFLGTAVVQPGMFNPIGTIIAIYFLTTGIFGLQLLGFSGWIQNVFYGAGLVVAVTLAKVVRDRSKTD